MYKRNFVHDIFNPLQNSCSSTLAKTMLQHDIICLQDTRLRVGELSLIKNKFQSQLYIHATTVPQNTSKKSETLIAIKRNRISKILKTGFLQGDEEDPSSRASYVLYKDFQFEKNILIVSVYQNPRCPASNKRTYNYITQTINNNRHSLIILGGDLNVDIDNNKTESIKEKLFSKFLDKNNIQDSYRYLYQSKDLYNGYTFESNDTTKRHSRIDYLLVSPEILTPKSKIKIIHAAEVDSDHNALSFLTTPPTKTRPPWKFKDELLKSNTFKSKLQDSLTSWIKPLATLNPHPPLSKSETSLSLLDNNIPQDKCSFHLLYDFINQTVKPLQSSETKKEACRLNQQIKDLKAHKEDLKKEPKTIETRTKIRVVNSKLNSIYRNKERNNKIQQLRDVIETGENLSKDFYKLFKSHLSRDQDIRSIRIAEDEYINNASDIDSFFTEQFDKMLRHNSEKTGSSQNDPQAFLDKYCPKPANNEPPPITLSITKEEVQQSIRRLKSKSSPGPDGITPSLVKYLFSLIPNFITNCVTNEIEGRKVCKQLKDRRIIVIKKKESSRKNWI